MGALHGQLDMARLLRPAIGYARDGCSMRARVAQDCHPARQHLAVRNATRSLFLPGGVCPQDCEIHCQDKLAETPEVITQQGRRSFTKGLAAAMVCTLRSRGGLHTEEDFHAVKGGFSNPIAVTYRGGPCIRCRATIRV